ncbi:MAG TPA: type II CRISPR-associated endonuclease Cas1 [Saprospiraceae bacterium]|nr:type II CRISPR-associated endonuclease Cas1 [Saprospiraceae bacterium]
MIKRTLYFGNPAYLHTENHQLRIVKKGIGLESSDTTHFVPIEDIGIVIFDHPQITFSHRVVDLLSDNNAVMIWCDEKHMPKSINLPLSNNDTYTEKLRYQINASEPLKKQLWKQTIECKIENQARVLTKFGYEAQKLIKMISRIQSGDPDNYEAQAAAIYWQQLLEPYHTTRGRYESEPNHYFNYGYAVLRAVIARNLVASGCLPALGIHHSNKYNAFCLADDLMEPYRPIVDYYIINYLKTLAECNPTLNKEDKTALLQIPVLDIMIEGKKSPLFVGSQRTTASFAQCMSGEKRKIVYPCLTD